MRSRWKRICRHFTCQGPCGATTAPPPLRWELLAGAIAHRSFPLSHLQGLLHASSFDVQTGSSESFTRKKNAGRAAWIEASYIYIYICMYIYIYHRILLWPLICDPSRGESGKFIKQQQLGTQTFLRRSLGKQGEYLNSDSWILEFTLKF